MMACLLFYDKLESSPYANLSLEKQWAKTERLFMNEFCSIIGLPNDDPLLLTIQSSCLALPKLQKLNAIVKEKKAEWSQQNELPVKSS